jgi:nicotinamidase-related amidase
MAPDIFIKARPYDYPYDGQLEAARTALLVIDMQVDFLAPDGYFARKGYDPGPLRAILPQLGRTIEAARAVGVLVIYTRQGYRADLADMSAYERWRRRRAGLDGSEALLRGTPGFALVPELEVAPGDIVIDKTANDAFCYTDLDHILRWRGVTHLLFSGCTTDVCVSSTMRQAADRNYQCLLIEDAVASGDAYAHAAAIHMVTVEDGVFGVVANTDAVIAGFGALPRR